jgi:hypothetical protein
MAGKTRDRVTLDLRGIGDAVRSAARVRNTTIAALARRALVDALEEIPTSGHLIDLAYVATCRPAVKLTLRLPSNDAERLAQTAHKLGLSYGALVARLLNGTPLPMPATDRQADRAALSESNDQLAALSTDLNALMRLLRLARSAEVAGFRQRIATVDTEIRQHLDRVSAFICNP